MADIATILKWAPETMEHWSLEYLARQHKRAITRWKVMTGQADD